MRLIIKFNLQIESVKGRVEAKNTLDYENENFDEEGDEGKILSNKHFYFF